MLFWPESNALGVFLNFGNKRIMYPPKYRSDPTGSIRLCVVHNSAVVVKKFIVLRSLCTPNCNLIANIAHKVLYFRAHNFNICKNNQTRHIL